MGEIKSYSNILFLFFLTATLLASPFPEDNETNKFEPVFKPILTLIKSNGLITIDGLINDDGWIGAAETSSFTESYPDELMEPPIKIRVLSTYDNEYFYLAFIINDDPSKIRASLTDRDEIWNDDYVGILLDTYGDASWAYFIFSNPLGIQGDSRFVPGIGEDDGIDLLYESAGMITDKGYQVEMAIPFNSLRFPDKDQQIWKATFWITHPRESRSTYTWSASTSDNACWLCQYGTIDGITSIKPNNQIELLPSVVGSQVSTQKSDDDPNAGLIASDFAHDEGMGIKYRITPNMVLDATYNPDFSQVEADAAQIDVNEPFALFYSERRPFFQEGGDLFSTYKNIVYTRTINDPIAAAKLTGRFGNLNLAYIGAVDERTPLILPFEERSETLNTSLRSTSNIFRAKQTFGNTGYLGFLVTDRRIGDDGVGSLVSVDGTYRFLELYRFEWQVMGSRTVELNDSSVTANYSLENIIFGKDKLTAIFDGEQFNGSSAYLSFERDSKNWSFDFDYYSTSPTFRSGNGFISQNNRRVFTMMQGYTFYPKAEWVDRINSMLIVERNYNFDNLVKDEGIVGYFGLNLKGQTTISLTGIYGNEIFGYHSQRFKGYKTLEFYGSTAFSEILRFGTEYSIGTSIYRNPSNPLLAYITNMRLWGTFKPVQWLSFRPTIDYYEMHYPEDPTKFPADYQGNANDMAGKDIYSGYIARIEMNSQFTRELFLRTIFEYNDFNKTIDVDLLITYRINPFSAIYIGSSNDYLEVGNNSGFNKTLQNYFFKVQYLFRI